MTCWQGVIPDPRISEWPMPGTACAKAFTRYLRVVAFQKRKFPLDKGHFISEWLPSPCYSTRAFDALHPSFVESEEQDVFSTKYLCRNDGYGALFYKDSCRDDRYGVLFYKKCCRESRDKAISTKVPHDLCLRRRA